MVVVLRQSSSEHVDSAKQGIGEGTSDNGEHEQDDKEVDEDSFDGGDLEAELESDIPIHGSASVEATPLLSDVLEGLHSVIVDEIGSAIDQNRLYRWRLRACSLGRTYGHSLIGEFSDTQGDCDVMMTEEIVPEQEVVHEQVNRDDDMDLGHGTATLELDHSDVKLPQDVVGLEPLGNLAGKPLSVQQSITTSLILAGITAIEPDDSSVELPQDARDDWLTPLGECGDAQGEFQSFRVPFESLPLLNTLKGNTWFMLDHIRHLARIMFGQKARENLEALDCQIEELKKALAELDVIRNSVPEASLAIVLAGTSSLNGLA
uniref:Uncharacterized protein n=1 Tax=Fagus sylvatica TaxID=28930 RepID=A0A2N9F8U6_FAGSY